VAGAKLLTLVVLGGGAWRNRGTMTDEQRKSALNMAAAF
jgi:hypothetical protein